MKTNPNPPADAVAAAGLERGHSCPLCFAQPEGLAEGSRRSPGGFWGRRPPGNGLEDVLHPGRGGSTSGFDLAPLRGAGNQATLSGGRSPPGPERPPATLCQPSGLASDQIEMEFVSRALEVSTACPGRHHRPEAAGWYRAQLNRGSGLHQAPLSGAGTASPRHGGLNNTGTGCPRPVQQSLRTGA